MLLAWPVMFAPPRAKWIAIALPVPWLAPVTRGDPPVNRAHSLGVRKLTFEQFFQVFGHYRNVEFALIPGIVRSF